ncbi:MAG: hypothetical protein ABI645_00020 [Pseudomonadota bacterium]
MLLFPLHITQCVPAESRDALEALQGALGFIPNVAAAMATSPVLMKSLVGLFQNVRSGSFSDPEIQVVLLTNAVTNR